ncbi:hypothetical protein QN372_05965 [Undibacterium sp. RTI2.1]|uniref:DUF7079 family protein n=1 Tax=unclassified Undibacterium TaxID=2630295 RepID=UPI002AB3B747|nr:MULTISPECIES: hypothetical protein [unclassified Undibacterium]MDY7538648.1 hypothetical protein [Undibacterium sp. 5I1]MEB0030283.1 hypothetical protein [Undibacterium sp. RTI2.1]MEB0116907.1 hypothetical protein [Undibacterium sp. RTI2.2]MEB0232137.1 hypothetical protein [Undibacterium sp. 10I3]MEB0259451.1 hypothetical protein [Undibacterium sp. 5I1]
MSAALTADDLLLRAPVWEALSDFWLDTELQDFQFDHIARVIAASPYSIEEVIAIHNYEVAPAVSANLGSIAGEWSGFDSEWLNSRCIHFASRRQSIWFKSRIALQLQFQWIFTVRRWRRLIPQIQSIRRVEANSTQLTNR